MKEVFATAGALAMLLLIAVCVIDAIEAYLRLRKEG